MKKSVIDLFVPAQMEYQVRICNITARQLDGRSVS